MRREREELPDYPLNVIYTHLGSHI